MNIIVCVKQILDPEIPPGRFNIDSEKMRVIPPEGIPPVINPFDEQAMEAALRIKDSKKDTKITVLSLGDSHSRDILKHCLSMGADEAFLLEDASFSTCDSAGLAYALSMSIRKIGPFNLILCGRQAADWDEGQTGACIAENFGIPLVTLARKVEILKQRLRVERVTLEGYEVVESSLPALVTISNELGLPRLPTGMGIMQAMRKQITIWSAENIQADISITETSRLKTFRLYRPVRESKCEFIEGKDITEAAINLALRLREAKII